MKKRNYSPHDELLNLSSDGGGEIFHKLNVARYLEVRKLEKNYRSFDEQLELVDCRFGSVQKQELEECT